MSRRYYELNGQRYFEVMQNQITWFPSDRPDLAPPAELREEWCNPAGYCLLIKAKNPFSNFVGNAHAVRRLSRAAFKAFERYNHCCADQAFALLGPSSSGKTTLARMFAKLLDLPFVEISPQSVRTLDDVLYRIVKVCEETQVGDQTLELEELEENKFQLPPLIVFIDEVHGLSKRIETGLLKAIEPNDATLITESGLIVDTKQACWIVATTDRGSLLDAFDNRFSKIHLGFYSLEEIAQIVHVHNLDWGMDVCQLAAQYGGRVPREALAFAREMRLENEMHGGSWQGIVATVAADNGIDKFGMSNQRVAILTALGKGPVSKARLCGIANCEEAELSRFIMPPLLASTADQQALVKVTGRGMAITKAGLAELDRRGIPYAPDLFVRKSSLRNRLGRNTEN